MRMMLRASALLHLSSPLRGKVDSMRAIARGETEGGTALPKIAVKRCPPFRLRSPMGSRIHLPPQGGKNLIATETLWRA